MEAVRPQVDLFVWRLLRERTFRANDFTETRRGVCWVLSPLSHELAETTTTWAAMLGPVVERTAKMLGKQNAKSKQLPTPLTQTNRSRGRDAVRNKPKKAGQMSLPELKPVCKMCGQPIDEGRIYCDACLPEFRKEQLPEFEQVGVATLARLRAEGRDSAHTEEVKAQVGKTVSAHRRKVLEWDASNERPDRETYERDILPIVQRATLPQLMRATGLSLKYCADIRKGRVPHPRHWETLRSVCVLSEFDFAERIQPTGGADIVQGHGFERLESALHASRKADPGGEHLYEFGQSRSRHRLQRGEMIDTSGGK